MITHLVDRLIHSRIALCAVIAGILIVPPTNGFAEPPNSDRPRELRRPTNQLTRPDRSDRTNSTLPFDLNSPATRRMVSSLLVVLGGFLLVVLLTRLQSSRSKTNPADELIQIVGRKSISAKHHLLLVEVQNKRLLLVETPAGLQKLESIDVTDANQLMENVEQQPDDEDSRRLLEMIQNRTLVDSNLSSRGFSA